jgi:hypothetical protein
MDLKSKRLRREILLPHTDPTKDGRPVRSEVRVSIVQAVALFSDGLAAILSVFRSLGGRGFRENRGQLIDRPPTLIDRGVGISATF